jgi:hypothetical protein
MALQSTKLHVETTKEALSNLTHSFKHSSAIIMTIAADMQIVSSDERTEPRIAIYFSGRRHRPR